MVLSAVVLLFLNRPRDRSLTYRERERRMIREDNRSYAYQMISQPRLHSVNVWVIRPPCTKTSIN